MAWVIIMCVFVSNLITIWHKDTEWFIRKKYVCIETIAFFLISVFHIWWWWSVPWYISVLQPHFRFSSPASVVWCVLLLCWCLNCYVSQLILWFPKERLELRTSRLRQLILNISLRGTDHTRWPCRFPLSGEVGSSSFWNHEHEVVAFFGVHAVVSKCVWVQFYVLYHDARTCPVTVQYTSLLTATVH